MATETIDIIVRENGSRVVKRKLEEIGDVAANSVRGLRLLQNALYVLGGAGLLAGLVRMVDTLVNFRNRLVLVTDSTAELNKVQQSLFDIASRTRTSYESTAEVYTRAALAVRQLGLSQQETLDFTESLNKATILSGASVREANAALIQLSQGLSSNRLSGDELRSVLEQLPYVADIIAKQLGITRGQLRQFGREGKISAQTIITAFKNAREEINDRFAKTIPTIGQAFGVLRTEALRVLDRFNQLTGASGTVAKAIIGIADSLEFLVAGLTVSAAAFGAFKLTQFVQGIVASIAANRELAAAVAQGNAVLLTAVEIENAKAASALKDAQATLTQAAADRASAAAAVAQLEAQRAVLLQQQASIRLDAQRKIARDALTGRFIAYDAALAQNVRTNVALTRTENLLAASRAELTAATVTQTEAEVALTAAQGRSAVAGAAAGTWTAKLARAFPGLASVIGLVARGFAALWAVIVANPIGAIIAAIVAVVAALVFFSDKITVTSDGVVTLRDVFVAGFQLIMEAIAPVGKFLTDTFGPALTWVKDRFVDLWNGILTVLGVIGNGIKTFVNLYIGYWVFLFKAAKLAWDNFPGAIDAILKSVVNLFLAAIETIVNAWQAPFRFIAEGLSYINQEASAKLTSFLDNFKLNLPRAQFSDAGKEFSADFQKAFVESFSTDYIGNGLSAVMERARQIANQRLADLNKKGEAGGAGAGAGAGGNKKTFADFVRELTTENELLKLNSSEREKLQAVLKIEKALKRSLTDGERELIMSLLDENEVRKKAAELYKQVKEPADEYALTIKALNELLKEGKFNQDEFNRSVLDARIKFLDTQTDAMSGFERGFLKILKKTGDYATQTEAIITRAFDGMSQGIADLVVDGKADFGSLIKSINKMIVQLVVSQAFQMLFGKGGPLGGIAGSIFGGGGATPPIMPPNTNGIPGIFGSGGLGGGILSLVKGVGSLFGFADGGSFNVGPRSAIASLPGDVDNRVVAFRARDGENVTVTPRGQSPGGQPIQVIFNVTTPDARSFKESQSQLAAKAARVIAQGRRNM